MYQPCCMQSKIRHAIKEDGLGIRIYHCNQREHANEKYILDNNKWCSCLHTCKHTLMRCIRQGWHLREITISGFSTKRMQQPWLKEEGDMDNVRAKVYVTRKSKKDVTQEAKILGGKMSHKKQKTWEDKWHTRQEEGPTYTGGSIGGEQQKRTGP